MGTKGNRKHKPSGHCALTGIQGAYVKSHLVPAALTYPETNGARFYQGGSGMPVQRRSSSWYDPALVTATGEQILGAHDDWAIKFLRNRKLVWSGWGPMTSLGSLHQPLHSGVGVRAIATSRIEALRLRLFLLSLLWRAAATKLPEFNEVALRKDDLESLRVFLTHHCMIPVAFYPAQLIQLSTLGTIHNHTPIAQVKTIPFLRGAEGRDIPIFRFYLDGLIVHFHRHNDDDGYTDRLGPVVVGKEDTVTVTTVTYETSFQRRNLETVMGETIGWPPPSFQL